MHLSVHKPRDAEFPYGILFHICGKFAEAHYGYTQLFLSFNIKINEAPDGTTSYLLSLRDLEIDEVAMVDKDRLGGTPDLLPFIRMSRDDVRYRDR